MSQVVSGTPIDCVLEGIEGTWPPPPNWLSFSSLKEAEQCPRRWALNRGHYPSVWNGNGYPRQPNLPSLKGDIVHDVLERVVNALIDGDCASAQGEDAIPVMRSLGGFTQLVRDSVDRHLASLGVNPRAVDRIEWFKQSLLAAVPEMRNHAQTLISRVDVRNSNIGDQKQSAPGLHDGPLPDGSYSERTIRSTSLGLVGRVDLLTLAGSEVHVVDYKTGEPQASHIDQMQTYAIIWTHHDNLDPDRPRVTQLTLGYINHDIEVEPPDSEKLQALSEALSERAKSIRTELTSAPPIARPGADACQFCPVRHMCEPYWTWLSTNPNDGDFIDLEVQVVERNGPRSWRISGPRGNGLLRTRDDKELRVGGNLRILGAVSQMRDHDDSPVWALTSASEVMLIRQI